MFSPLWKYLCSRERGLEKPVFTQPQAFMGQHATEDMTCLSPSEGTVRVGLLRARATFLESSSADAAPGNYHVQTNARDVFLIYITHQSSRCQHDLKSFYSAPSFCSSPSIPHGLDHPPRTATRLAPSLAPLLSVLPYECIELQPLSF